MTHDELIKQLLVERYAPAPQRLHIEDTKEAQQQRQADLLTAVKDFELHQSTTEQKRAQKRARHLRAVRSRAA